MGENNLYLKVKKNGFIEYQRRIPKKVAAIIGSEFIQKSLGTKDITIAHGR